MGYGEGRWWHRFYNFPNFSRVTKTLTLKPKTGIPFAVMKWNNSVYNRVGLHNVGIKDWSTFYRKKRYDVTVSIAGTDDDIDEMVEFLNGLYGIAGIELNFTCPNVKNYKNKRIPNSKIPLFLKLNHLSNPYEYDMDKIEQVRLNSVPHILGGMSGKKAQKYNWHFIEKYGKELDIAGCSFFNIEDVFTLMDLGCKDMGFGSILLTDPAYVAGFEMSKRV